MRPGGRGVGRSGRSLCEASGATRFVSSFALALVLVLALAPAISVAAGSGDVLQPTVQEPRAFGHLLGDIVTQRILLRAGDNDVGSVAPPSIGRTGAWFERRPARIETDAEGRRWMAIDYQIVNVAPTLTRIALPALTLTSASGATLQVAEWPLSIGPITSADAFEAGDLQRMRPDRQAPLMPTAPLRRQAAFALGLLLLTLLSWAGWWLWRNWRESARLPFARAWRQMRRLDGPNADMSADAWLCLHRALNETAGHVVRAGSLPSLLARAPYLQPLHAQLEQFYQQSGERFFTPAPALAPYPLRGLCRALYRAEQRHQR
ncbi:calcium incorporation protein MxaA [Paraburkholderia xenovorans]|uniref:calcium incorporation protein MxaA n=1 Tax=Paraburkholderia xenovorans TaxID=36873 RepID=UPI0015C55EC6|nr:calcium incorporation protein MxaA [Paraburkholderia xenovorans]NPT34067.1 calcium incorporation protein MxaA [Paraburkholderia xenovorans]